MEAQTILAVISLVLLRFGCGVLVTEFDNEEPSNGSDDRTFRVFSNGFENFLPDKPGADYKIQIRNLRYKADTNSECLLGTAYNYLPWLYPNGSLTIKNQTGAMDLSNLQFSDNAMFSLVSRLDSLISLNVSISSAIRCENML